MGTDDESDGVDALLAAAYAVDGPEANRALYADWAATYDETFVERSGYVYPRRVAEAFVDGFDTDAGPVLDVGCGTGVVGIELRALGLTTVDGVDLSPEMLEQAGAKRVAGEPVYRNLIEADLTGPIDLARDQYAGIVSAGTFTHGHLGPGALDELIRVARPGARCAIGINSAHFDDLGFRAFLDERRDAAVITPYELVDAPIYADAEHANADQVSLVAIFAVR
jgi:predicted TPR repeat methyltransferase